MLGIKPPVTHAMIRQFAENKINLPADIAKKRRAHVAQFRERLKKWMSENPDCGLVKSYLSGSLAKGTSLRTTSDVDVALYLNYDGPRVVDKTLIEWIASRIRQAFPQMKPSQIEPQEFSIKITFESAGYELDIVPVFYEGDPQDRGWLVSKRTGRLLMTSIPMHLEFIRARKKNSETHFAQVVRLVKWWTSIKKQDPSFRFKSFLVELICAHLIDGGVDFSDYPQAMTEFFRYVVTSGLNEEIVFSDYYEPAAVADFSDPVQVIDPVNPKNNVSSQYTDADRVRIVREAEDALDALNEAHTSASKGEAIELWRVVLGPTFRG